MDRGALRATAHGVAQSWTQLGNSHTHTHTHTHTHNIVLSQTDNKYHQRKFFHLQKGLYKLFF